MTPDAAARTAMEIALLIHDDYTLQIGEPLSYLHGDAFLACIEAHVAAALVEARRAALEEAARVADEVGSRDADPYYDGIPWQTVVINIAAAIRRLGKGE